MSIKLDLYNNLNPMEGLGERMILLSSEIMRSAETILMRSAFRWMASKVSF